MKYNQNFKIPYYETDKYGELRPVSLLKYLGEVSMIHNTLLVDMEEMKRLNYGWMLNRWKVKIDRYPKGGENIRIETWISGAEKFYAYREFIIYDEEDLEIGKVSAVWIFMDMNRKRPIRIQSEHYDLKNILNLKNFSGYYRFQSNIEVSNIIDFHIRKSDIDYNDHVNNSKYLEWMVETIPDNIYRNYMLSEFEIIYKKEIKYPNTILSGNKEVENLGDEIKYIHKIVDKEFQEEKSLGISKWKIR